MLESERICRVAVDEQGRLMGIIVESRRCIMSGSFTHWQFSRLCRDRHRQGAGGGFRGTGSRHRGGLTITLGSDDEDNMTSLSGVDLYENLWRKSGIFAT